MTQQSQLVLVCEKLLGLHFYTPFDEAHPGPVCKCGKVPSEHPVIPPLTLDLMWECEEKLWNLSPNSGYQYECNLIKTTKVRDTETGFLNFMKLYRATAEQRLAALVQTIKDL